MKKTMITAALLGTLVSAGLALGSSDPLATQVQGGKKKDVLSCVHGAVGAPF